MKRTIKTSGGPIKATDSEIDKMGEDIRSFLIDRGFGLCDRGPVTFDFIAILYGARQAKRLWARKRRQVEQEEAQESRGQGGANG